MSVRECNKCGAIIEPGKPDPCLGYLPGIAHACCGHGNIAPAYCVGWPGCKPNESCYIKYDINKQTYHPAGPNSGHYEFDNETWDGELPPKEGVWYPPREGIFTLRHEEAIEYMERLKNGTNN